MQSCSKSRALSTAGIIDVHASRYILPRKMKLVRCHGTPSWELRLVLDELEEVILARNRRLSLIVMHQMPLDSDKTGDGNAKTE